MGRKKKEDNIVEDLTTPETIDFEIENSSENILKAEEHALKALSFIKENKKEEAKNEIDIAYSLDENNASIFLAKLYLKYHLKSFNDFAKKADNEIINSAFFKAAYELGDEALKEKLDEVVEEVEYKEVEIRLEDADVEQLLKHLRIQKQKGIDYTYTISLILSILYRSFRYIDKDYIDENYNKDNFIPVLKKMESSFQFYMDILYHFDDISDIKDIASQCVKDHKDILSYILIYLKKLIENTEDTEKLNEIKDFIEYSYLGHEADDLLKEISPKLKKKNKLSIKGLSVAFASFIIVLGVTGISVITAINASNAPVTYNGVTYAKNDNNGYTIIGYDFVDNNVVFENTINDLPVNALNSDIFTDSSITSVTNFPSAIKEIPENEFYSCDYLTSFIFYEEESSLLTSIGESAFKDCTSLTTITIPTLVEEIGDNAFLNTPYLVNINKLSDKDFDETKLGLTKRNLTIDFNGGTEYEYQTSFYSWDTLTLPSVDKSTFDFIGFSINDDIDFIKKEDDEEVVSFKASGYSSITLKATYETAKEILDKYGITYTLSEDKSYYEITNFTPNNLYSYSITLAYQINGIKVTKLNENVFQNNRNLKQINNFSHYIKEIPDNAFKGCSSLSSFIFSSFTSTLTRVGESAFEGCVSLKEFNLPSSVTEIGDNAFKNTTSLLNFSNTFDFKESEDNPYYDFERIGFNKRNYVIKNTNDEVIQEGIYYIPQEKLKIETEIKENQRPVIINNLKTDTYEVGEINKTFYLYDVSNQEKIDLTLNYENYYDETNYSFDIDTSRISSLFTLISPNSLKVDLYSSLISLKTNTKIRSSYSVKYEVVEGYTSSLIPSIEGSILTIYKNEESRITPAYLSLKAYLIGDISSEIMMESEIFTISINVF